MRRWLVITACAWLAFALFCDYAVTHTRVMISHPGAPSMYDDLYYDASMRDTWTGGFDP